MSPLKFRCGSPVVHYTVPPGYRIILLPFLVSVIVAGLSEEIRILYVPLETEIIFTFRGELPEVGTKHLVNEAL